MSFFALRIIKTTQGLYLLNVKASVIVTEATGMNALPQQTLTSIIVEMQE